ncbi:MAG: 6,7-dimethyl-8-ribityllumazine synthase [bacterium]
MKEITGQLNAVGLKLGIVVSRFNSVITEKLLDAAVDTFGKHGGSTEELTVVRVPGSFEIPIAAQRLARSGRCDAIVCLGCLIRGETKHFDFLAEEVTRGIDEVALKEGLPVSYGVITSETVEQAMNRAGLKHGNKGVEATVAVLEMASVLRQLADNE